MRIHGAGSRGAGEPGSWGAEEPRSQEEALGELRHRAGAESPPVAAPPGGLGGALLPRARAARLPSRCLRPTPGEQKGFKGALSGTGVCIPGLTAASPPAPLAVCPKAFC